MPEINCPKCGEQNPAEAVMCWACYTPLKGTGKPSGIVPKAEVEEPVAKGLGGIVSDNLPYLLLSGLTSSGWLSRRARWPVLGVSLIGFGGLFVAHKWSERNVSGRHDEVEDDFPPNVRIANTILFYALKENADAIRLQEDGRGIRVCYQIEGEWREQMKIPLYVWRALRQVLLEQARQGGAQINAPLHIEPDTPPLGVAALSADLQSGASGETLTLRFAKDALRFDAKPLQLAPDCRCAKCHEANAPGAVWCWNCYATIEAPSLAPHIKEAATNIGIISVLAALVSSGWWPRRARPFALGAGLSGAALAFGWSALREQFKDFKIELPGKRDGANETKKPVDDLVEQILSRAAEFQAKEIRLQERGNVAVIFDDEARERLVLPPYVWLALRGRLLELARSGACELGDTKQQLRSELSSDADGETLRLHLGA